MTIKENRAIPEGKKRIPLSFLGGKKGNLKMLASPLFIGGILLVLYAGFGVAYFQKQADAEDFQSQISKNEEILNRPAAALNLDDLVNQRATGEAELEQKRSELEKVRFGGSLLALSPPGPEQSIDLYKEILDFGAAANLSQSGGVKITSISASGVVKGKNNGTTLTYSLSAEGTRYALLNFISSLIKSQKYLGSMELSNIAISGGTKSSDSATLSLSIAVHTWEVEK
jgi:hypothetical protein